MILTTNSRAERVRLWREQHMAMLRLEPRLRRALLDEFRSAGHQAVMALVAGRSYERAMENHAAHVRAILAKNYRRAGDMFSGRYMRRAVKCVPFRIETKAARETYEANYAQWVNTWSGNKAEGIARVTKNRVRQAIIAGEANGDGIDVIAAAIRTETGGLLGRARAVTIARTEIHAAANYANEAIADALKLGKRVNVWAATEDERTRQSHADADGQEVNEGELFDVGGASLRFPGDPNGPAEEVVNCRCVLLHRYPDLEDSFGG